MPYDPPPEPQPPAPPAAMGGAAPSGRRVAFRVFLGVALLFAGWCFLGTLLTSTRPDPATTTLRPLEHVVAYKSRIGFQVCSRTPLRRCILDFVSDASGTARTVRIGPIDVDPVPSCETIMDDANAACADGGFGPGMRWARCAALHGFISRTLARTLDPRDDPHAHPPGGFILNCEEGYLNGSFDDTM